MKTSFGQKFSQQRKLKGYTQEYISEKLNVSPQAVSKWENDLSYPDITLLKDISILLDISIDELLGSEKKVETEVVPVDSRDISKMLLKICVLSSDGDKVKINLPIALLKAGLDMGITPKINGNSSFDFSSIDFNQLIEMVEKGVIGKLLEIESADGDIVEIYVD
jgi:transcriptional regulator with XRE-family HTH domain